MIFGVLNPQKIWHGNLTDLSTLPVNVTIVPWEIQKVIFNSSTHTYVRLFTLSQKETHCNPNVGGSEESQMWVVIGGSKKNRLWCVTTGLSSKQCHSKCSEWPFSAYTCFQSFSSLISHTVHQAVLKFSLCRNKPLPPASTCPHQYTRSSCSVPQTQY